MSEGEGGEKTEQPTQKKRDDAREKGQVWHSKEIVSTAVMLGAYLYFFFGWDTLLKDARDLFLIPVEFINQPFREALPRVVELMWEKTISVFGPFLGMAAGIAIFANYMHVGPVFAVEPIKPDLKKISPLAGFKKIFGMKNLIEFLKSVAKVALLAFILMYVIRINVRDTVLMPTCGIECIPAFLGEIMFDLALYSLLGFMIITAVDIVFQIFQHTKELKMTKDEVKREHKNMEGSPEIKRERKNFHREILEGGVEQKVKKSSVVITNPKHLAVGLCYKKEEAKLPYVTIKGKDGLALRIKDLAYRNNIPVIENVELAHSLYDEVDTNRYIPAKLIEPVAAVLRWLRSLEEGSD